MLDLFVLETGEPGISRTAAAQGDAAPSEHVLQLLAKGDDLLLERLDLRWCLAARLKDAAGEALGFLLQAAPLVGQAQLHYALIRAAAGAGDQPLGLQTLEQGGYRAGIGKQPGADLAHGDAVP